MRLARLIQPLAEALLIAAAAIERWANPVPELEPSPDPRPLSLFSTGHARLSSPDAIIRMGPRAQEMADLAHKLDLDIAFDLADRRPPLYLIPSAEPAMDGRLLVRTNMDALRSFYP